MTLPTQPAFADVFGEACDQLMADVRAGRVPLDVPDFATLHDYVDANGYGGFCDDEVAAAMIAAFGGMQGENTPEAYADFVTGIQDAMDTWIRDGGLRAQILCDDLNRFAEGRGIAFDGPPLRFDVVPAADVGVLPGEFPKAPRLLITFGENVATIDPHSSTCGRFWVPAEENGLTLTEATLIRAHNRVVMAVAPCSAKQPQQGMLWYFEYAPGDDGVWDKKWFGTEGEATTERDRMISDGGYDPDLESGERGSILSVCSARMPTNAAEALAFAREFAVDSGGY